jgi:hypothetical protein
MAAKQWPMFRSPVLSEIPDGFLAATLYGFLIVLAAVNPEVGRLRYVLRGLAVLAALTNILGVFDMSRFAASAPTACSRHDRAYTVVGVGGVRPMIRL